MASVNVSVPDGNFIRLHLQEADGTPAIVDLTPMATGLTHVGSVGPARDLSERVKGPYASPAWVIDCSDGVEFTADGAPIAQEIGLRLIADGVLYALMSAVHDTLNEHADDPADAVANNGEGDKGDR